jgi:hypothetical protein
MAYNPYSELFGQEYNPNGDAANGTAGSMTSGSIQNAAIQNSPAGKSGDPFTGMLAHAQAINAVKNGRRRNDAKFQPGQGPGLRVAPNEMNIPQKKQVNPGLMQPAPLGAPPQQYGGQPGGGSGWSSITDGGNGNYLGTGPYRVGPAPQQGGSPDPRWISTGPYPVPQQPGAPVDPRWISTGPFPMPPQQGGDDYHMRLWQQATGNAPTGDPHMRLWQQAVNQPSGAPPPQYYERPDATYGNDPHMRLWQQATGNFVAPPQQGGFVPGKGNGQKYEGTTNAGGPNYEYAMQEPTYRVAAMQTSGPDYEGGGGTTTPEQPPPAPVPPPVPEAPLPVENPQLPAPVRNPDGTTTQPPPDPTTGRGGRGVRTGAPLPNPTPNAPPPNPGTVPDWVWNTAVRYAKEGGEAYKWLLQRPQVIQMYHEEMSRLGEMSRGIDFVDWVQSRFTNLPEGSNPLYKRKGYDTYTHNADGTLRGFGSENPAYNPGGTPAPSSPVPGTPGGPAVPPPPNPEQPRVIIPPGAPVPPYTPPPPAPPETGAPGTPPPTGGTPPPTAPTSPTTPSGEQEDWFTKLKAKIDEGAEPGTLQTSGQYDYEKRIMPLFQRQQQELERRMRAQGALDKRQNSGGFGMQLGSAMADLNAQQGAQLADTMVKTGEAGLDRALQKYLGDQNTRSKMIELGTEAGMQKYLAELNNDLERHKIKTNDDLQRYLNGQDNALKKYGIDKDDLLERYKAELQLEGAKANASSNVSAARLQAAASKAASNAAREAQRYDADVRLRLGLYGTDVERENNLMRYQLGVWGLSPDIIKLIMGASPDTQVGATPPGTVVVKP